jgi:hypothetical protein
LGVCAAVIAARYVNLLLISGACNPRPVNEPGDREATERGQASHLHFPLEASHLPDQPQRLLKRLQGRLHILHAECAKANEEEKFVSLVSLVSLVAFVSLVSAKLENPVILRISDVDESVLSCIIILYEQLSNEIGDTPSPGKGLRPLNSCFPSSCSDNSYILRRAPAVWGRR